MQSAGRKGEGRGALSRQEDLSLNRPQKRRPQLRCDPCREGNHATQSECNSPSFFGSDHVSEEGGGDPDQPVPAEHGGKHAERLDEGLHDEKYGGI